uniref:(northern house mosquito) hypothetical protein n=1 Tax=Culex pipiens TaxID=7175 RepID=A0A8D8B3C5_CULPI
MLRPFANQVSVNQILYRSDCPANGTQWGNTVRNGQQHLLRPGRARCLRRFRRGPGAKAGFASARAGPLPADRQHYQNYEEGHSGEREDRERRARMRSGVRFGVYFVHHVRG